MQGAEADDDATSVRTCVVGTHQSNQYDLSRHSNNRPGFNFGIRPPCSGNTEPTFPILALRRKSRVRNKLDHASLQEMPRL